MLPPPVVSAAPCLSPVAVPLSVSKQTAYKRYDPNATLQNIAPCALTRSDYDRLRMMVDKQVLSQMPVTDTRMVSVDLPTCLTDTYLPLPTTFAPSRTMRPWLSGPDDKSQSPSGSMLRLRHKLAYSVRVNPVFCVDVLVEMLPTTIFCIGTWLYLFNLLGLKSPVVTSVCRALHLFGLT